jgi:uncharacterized membrane-anchored protein YjiN (DUF445 family)
MDAEVYVMERLVEAKLAEARAASARAALLSSLRAERRRPRVLEAFALTVSRWLRRPARHARGGRLPSPNATSQG